MLSAIPAMFSSEPMIGNPFPAFENGFSPWDFDLFSAVTQSSPPKPETNRNQTNSNSGSDEPNPLASLIDERKQRRMISNRESARRSRMRKQRHLENLRNQVNRLRIENRELTHRLQFLLYHCQRVRTDNDRLRSEHSMLRRKLSEIHELLVFRQLQQFTSAWPCNNVTSEQTPSLIT
ncbi:hypothetical protein Pint_27852 [Pistacia integerrima]|uniref:Uncharacterized protein n=1 Tax=Pistacia integerrima TaxID=434235 RepID=A0ACC0YNT3_9ROSI|nr:hypothetical protein Pint_27852 [Pistacia integerrima]